MHTYTWSIQNNLMVETVNGNPDTVVLVPFKVDATDGTNTASLNNSIQLVPNPANPFIPFASLTEAEVLAWVKDTLTADKVAIIESTLTKMLEHKASPVPRPVPKSAPWATGA